jgi:hypothetical protein
MKNLVNALYEHLITKKKYNKLLIQLEGFKEDLERKTLELNTNRKLLKKEKAIWDKILKEQEEEIIELKRRKINEKSKTKNTRISTKKQNNK